MQRGTPKEKSAAATNMDSEVKEQETILNAKTEIQNLADMKKPYKQ